MKTLPILALLTFVGSALCLNLRGVSIIEHPDKVKRADVQKLVSWDQKSLFIKGERVMLFSGEVHPFRLPVPSLWLDVFQKLKSSGYNCVSFYTDWALHESERGKFVADGIFNLEPFFDAAKEAGIYLIARPWPYINAEVSGGGFPGWMQRVKSPFRAFNPAYLEATDIYMNNIVGTISRAQITNGGPIILFQPENEYTLARNGALFPDGTYMQYVIDQAHDAGIVVPIISNDAHPRGYNAPGTGIGQVDIYGHDGYPFGFNCAQPDWPAGKLPTNLKDLHLRQSPGTPYSILEFQGGSYDTWGGKGYEQCAKLINHEFTRVFNKNNFSFGIKIFNLYMAFGGTNWGNLGYPRGYTSYDFGASIREDRSVAREKYSDTKLLAYFAKAVPSYREAIPGNLTTSLTNSKDISVTPLKANITSFWVVRHTDYGNLNTTDYKITLLTSEGISQSLNLVILVTDLKLKDGSTLLYSSAEILAVGLFNGKETIIIYGGLGEHHELEIRSSGDKANNVEILEGQKSGFLTSKRDDRLIIAWDVVKGRQTIEIGDLRILILDRNSAYNYWVTELEVGIGQEAVIINGPYLVRSAKLSRNGLRIAADFNQTTMVEVLVLPSSAKNLYINAARVKYSVNAHGTWSAKVNVILPKLELPDFHSLRWKYIDSLPEVKKTYDDRKWTTANLAQTYNDYKPQLTPTSLFSGDYGYHSGTFIYRGHFTASGNESEISLWTQGGWASSSSVWLDESYLGSSRINATLQDANTTYVFPKLQAGDKHVLTVLQDNQGYELNPWVGDDEMKHPRGIRNYTLQNRNQDAIEWKLTGNLMVESYVDKVRGPLNEGGFFAERQGFHQPSPPTHRPGWSERNPISKGLDAPGIGYFVTSFSLDIPHGWDVPLYFTFGNSTVPPRRYRAQLFVNGYNFGRYLNVVGPQTTFHVPEGILNYHGENWVGLTIWCQEVEGMKLDDFRLEYRMPVLSSMAKVKASPQPKWKERNNAY